MQPSAVYGDLWIYGHDDHKFAVVWPEEGSVCTVMVFGDNGVPSQKTAEVIEKYHNPILLYKTMRGVAKMG